MHVRVVYMCAIREGTDMIKKENEYVMIETLRG